MEDQQKVKEDLKFTIRSIEIEIAKHRKLLQLKMKNKLIILAAFLLSSCSNIEYPISSAVVTYKDGMTDTIPLCVGHYYLAGGDLQAVYDNIHSYATIAENVKSVKPIIK